MEQLKYVGIFGNSTATTAGFLWLMLLMVGCSKNKAHITTATIPSTKETYISITTQDTSQWPVTFGFGRPAHANEIAALDIDVHPDGTGLPAGSGDAVKGKTLYAAKCAACHGIIGNDGPNDKLVGIDEEDALPFGQDPTRVKTIGNYWPYATTVFDYIRRAMPYHAPGSLSNEEVYSLTAFLLHANKIIDSTTVINAYSLPKVVMPGKVLFVEDDRRGGAEIR